VVLLAFDEGEAHIWDLDSTHGAPLPASAWFSVTAPKLEGLADVHQPRFRVVGGEVFDEVFSSDRSHMRGLDGQYFKDPPAWPAPFQPDRGMNLMKFAVSNSTILGEELSCDAFVKWTKGTG
jgi:hypothetical protein